MNEPNVLSEVILLRGAVKAVHQRMDTIDSRLAAQETATAGVLAVWNAGSGGLKVLGWLGELAKWLAYIAGGCAALYALTKFGGKA